MKLKKAKLILFLVLISTMTFVGCETPFSVTQINVSRKNSNDSSSPSTTTTSFSVDIPFDTGSDANYSFSNTNYIELNSNVVRLKPVDQTDSVQSDFLAGTLSGVQWDNTNGVLRLNSNTNTNELDSTWAPKYSNLVGYWKLNENSYTNVAGEVIDSSSNSNHGIFSVAATNSLGKLNKAPSFDGVSTAATISDNNFYDGGSAFTISAWFKPTDIAATSSYAQGIVSKRVNYDNNQSWDIFLWNGYLYVDVNGTANRTTVDLIPIEDNKWYHVALVFDGTLDNSGIANDRLKIYLNGTLVKYYASASTTILHTTSNVMIGSLPEGGISQVFKGMIDEVAIWNTALSYGDIHKVYNQQIPSYSGKFTSQIFDSLQASSTWTDVTFTTTIPFGKELPATNGSESTANYSGVSPSLMTNLLAYWKLNEYGVSGANSIVDSSGNNNHITPVDQGVGGLFYLGYEIGPFSISPYIDGTKLTTNSSLLNSRTNFTISGWVKPLYATDPISGSTRIPFFGQDNVFEVGLLGGYPCVSADIDSSWSCSPTKMELNKWHHVVATAGANDSRLYVDGALVATLTHNVVGGDYGANTNFFNLGYDVFDTASYGGSQFSGSMDEVAVWNRTLSSTEIINLYRRGGNQIQYQIRSCANADCSDQEALSGKGWQGATSSMNYFLNEAYNYNSIGSYGVGSGNVKAEKFNLPFSRLSGMGAIVGESDFNLSSRRYVQYRAFLNSFDTNNLCNYGSGATSCSPELKSVSFGPDHYSTTAQTIISSAAIGSSFISLDTNGFTESLGGNGCSSGVKYTLSNDGSHFYYYNGTTWVIADGTYTQANSAAQIRANISSIHNVSGPGTIQVKTFLKSDGTSACEVDNLLFNGLKI